MTFTGVSTKKVWLPPGPPTVHNQVLMAKADLSGWEPHAFELRLKSTDDRVVQMNTPSGWQDLVNPLSTPSHWTNDAAVAAVANDGSWRDGAQLAVPVLMGHRYLVLATAEILWTNAVGSVSGRLTINGAQVGRQTFPGADKRVTFHRGTIFTAVATGTLTIKIQYGANQSSTGVSLPASHLDIVEQR